MKIELKGAVKIAFENYLLKTEICVDKYSVEIFHNLPISMQIGVLQLFFDSVGIMLDFDSIPTSTTDINYHYNVKWVDDYDFSEEFDIREKTWVEGFNKAQEIFNNR